MYTELQSPIYGTWKGLPVIVIGGLVEGMMFRWVCVGMDGTIIDIAPTDLVVDVRYKDGEWHDVSPGPEDPEMV